MTPLKFTRLSGEGSNDWAHSCIVCGIRARNASGIESLLWRSAPQIQMSPEFGGRESIGPRRILGSHEQVVAHFQLPSGPVLWVPNSLSCTRKSHDHCTKTLLRRVVA